ncbi:MAG: permease of phosphate ABC transporter [Lachnospiraceae bacterium]|nr:permease of phosphate ABC transporter [Lachnospiraceae bacterium]
MNKLFEFGNRYAGQSTWKDFALTKLCLFSMGLAAGTQVPKPYKKPVFWGAVCGFLAAYIPLIVKLVRVAVNREEN